MDSKTVQPASTLSGSLEVPGDKSISHRAVILGALSNRTCIVNNFLVAEDCLCTLDAFRALGIVVERQSHKVRIEGKGLDGLRASAQPLWFGNSGTTTRLMMGVLTGQPFEVRMEGDASLSRRPMDRVVDPLSQMGAFFLPTPEDKESDLGFTHLPIRMHGTRSVRPIRWKSPVASAQVKSAILLAGLYASGSTEVEEPVLSRDHTERMLKASGVTIQSQDNRVSLMGTATIRAHEFNVPGDLSSAAFLLAAGLLRSPMGVNVRGIGVNETRIGFLDLVKAMGGKIRLAHATEWAGEPVADIEAKQSDLKAVEIKGEIVPRAIDEIPILAVLATQAQGRTVISDAKELRVKESDRLASICAELNRMGARIREKPDGLEIEGPTPLRGAVVKSYGDHRLAMSLAVAALVAEGPTTIDDVACVNTSFPEFWTSLDRLRIL